jgi:hypothetical protein
VHGVLHLNAGDGVEGDWLGCCILRSLRGSSLLESSHDGHLSWDVVVKEIGQLQVEEMLALMAADIGLVAIVTRLLATALQLLRWRQPTEGTSRS